MISRTAGRMLRAIPTLLVGALLATLLVAAPAASSASTSSASHVSLATQTQAPDTDDSPEEDNTTDNEPVVFIGVAGLMWTDLSEDVTPNMIGLTGESVGSLMVRSVRSTACPADGWLAISAGNRAGDLAGPCRQLTEPGAGGIAPGWADYEESAAGLSYRARIGTFGEALETQGFDAVGIGPGAAIALADTQGRSANHLPRLTGDVPLSTQMISSAREADLVVVDAGAIRPVPRDYQARGTDEAETMRNPISPERWRYQQLQLIDRRVGSILTGLHTSGVDPTIVLAGLADDGTTSLRVLAVSGEQAEPGMLQTSSTRQTGYVTATDLTPSLISLLGGEPLGGDVIGAPLRTEATEWNASERRDELKNQNVHAKAVAPIVPTFYLIMVILNLALFAAMAVGLKRPAAERVRKFLARRAPKLADRLTAFTVHRRKVLRTMRVVALSIASLPVASFLANMMPWWAHTPAALGLAAWVAVFVAVIVTIALIGPWRRHVLGAPTVVAAITALVLTIDIATGATLQVSAVMGISTIVAGRMYGMNNTAFTLFTVSTLLVTVALANFLVQRGLRKIAGVVTLVIGIAVSIFDGAPSLGADFGGPPALLPAYGLLALMAAGVRLSVLRIFLVLGISAVATIMFAFVDWLRPAEDHTHLGRFFQTLIDGGVWDVIWRKLGQNISILFNNTPLTLLALCGVLTVIFVFARPIRRTILEPGVADSFSGGTPLSRMGQAAPMLPPGIIAIGVGLAIGMAVNDSGVAIPANGVAIGVPLLVAMCATWMLGLTKEGAHKHEVLTSEIPADDGATANEERASK